eukprot:6984966-Prymnesium_polylepis.1
MSGWDNLEGKNKRTGARVVDNAKLQQPGPPRAGPRQPNPVWYAVGARRRPCVSCYSYAYSSEPYHSTLHSRACSQPRATRIAQTARPVAQETSPSPHMRV